jgi:hypothetical protein
MDILGGLAALREITVANDGSQPLKRSESLSPEEREACHAFHATVIDFYSLMGKSFHAKPASLTVFDLLYGKGIKGTKLHSAGSLDHAKPSFRWYHLPANNVYAQSLTHLIEGTNNIEFR